MRRAPTIAATPPPAGRAPRGAVVALELLLIMPVLVLLAIMFVDTVVIVVADQRLVVAATEGSRAASLGGSQSQVTAAATASLGTGSLGTYVSKNPTSIQVTPDLTSATAFPYPTGTQYTVTIAVPVAAVLPNWMCPSTTLVATSTAIGQ